MKKFLLLVCIFVCATRVYCAATDDKYGWFTRLGMRLRRSRRRIEQELRSQGLYTHLLVKQESSNCWRVYHIFKDNNIAISEREIVEEYPNVNVKKSCKRFYMIRPQEDKQYCSEIIPTIALNHPQRCISVLRALFSEKDPAIELFFKELEGSIEFFQSKGMTGRPNYEDQQRIISENNVKCNSIIDKELSRATQCGVVTMVGVAAAGAGLYFLRNEIATGVKNGTSSLVAAVASGLGK